MGPIYTIGYGNRAIADFMALLKTNGLTYLADIRTAPWSRNREDFRRNVLAAHCHAAGITYVFLGDQLGGKPQDPALKEKESISYDDISETQPFRQGIERLKTAAFKEVPIVLMCAELHPENCHRSRWVGHALTGEGVEVRHIAADGTLLSQSEVEMKLKGEDEQPTLFG